MSERFLESLDVKTFRAFLAEPDSSVEVDFHVGFRRICKKTDRLIVPKIN